MKPNSMYIKDISRVLRGEAKIVKNKNFISPPIAKRLEYQIIRKK